MKALVCFYGNPAERHSRFLKEGFSHVFVAVLANRFWITFDGTAQVVDLSVAANEGYDLKAFYEDEGYTVVYLDVDRAPLRMPFILATCVGAVKAVLGIRHPFVFTPYQLYRHLLKELEHGSTGRTAGNAQGADGRPAVAGRHAGEPEEPEDGHQGPGRLHEEPFPVHGR